jgi:hypothetical protein
MQTYQLAALFIGIYAMVMFLVGLFTVLFS